MKNLVKIIGVLLIFSALLAFERCKPKSKSYPCPAYHSTKSSKDSSYSMGIYSVPKNKKSGLIEKKKTKGLKDRRKAG